MALSENQYHAIQHDSDNSNRCQHHKRFATPTRPLASDHLHSARRASDFDFRRLGSWWSHRFQNRRSVRIIPHSESERAQSDGKQVIGKSFANPILESVNLLNHGHQEPAQQTQHDLQDGWFHMNNRTTATSTPPQTRPSDNPVKKNGANRSFDALSFLVCGA
jgi:hypothetical protein